MLPDVHLELVGVSATPGRFTDIHPQFGAPAWRADNAARIADLCASDADTMVFSAEPLWYLRDAAEVERLVACLGGRAVDVVMYHRRPEDFLASYTFTLRVLGLEPTLEPDSIACVATDSWLLDIDRREALWSPCVRSFRRIDYDAAVALEGGVIPSFVRLLGIAPADPVDLNIFLNRTEDQRRKMAEALRRAHADSTSVASKSGAPTPPGARQTDAGKKRQ